MSARAAALTDAFYQWERRGRGWDVYSYPVSLEPPFSFPDWSSVATRQDDTRRESFLDRLFQRTPQATDVPDETEPEPPEPKEPTEYTSMTLVVPQRLDVSVAGSLAWLTSLSALREPLSFELLGRDGRVALRLSAALGDLALVRSALASTFPDVVVLDDERTLVDRWETDAGRRAYALEFGLGDEFVVPITLMRDLRVDPLAQIITALGKSRGLSILQVLFSPVTSPWADAVIRAVTTPSGTPFFADAPIITSHAREKISSRLVAAALRVVATSDSDEEAWDTIRGASGGLAQLSASQGNELIPVSSEQPERVVRDVLRHTSHRHGMILSLHELVGLVHIPSSSVKSPYLVRSTKASNAAPRAVTGAGVLLGANEHLGVFTDVRLPIEARLRHCHTIGASGTGKSTLLVSMMLDDIEHGYGVAVLDPHGDLVDELLARIPEHRHDDVIVFDPSDPDTIVGWNILGAGSELEKELLASDLVATFERLATSWGDQMTTVLSNAVLAFLNSTRGGTLFDLRQFLVNGKFRAEFLSTVTDEYIATYWREDFPLISGKKPQAPILTRLNMFLRNKQVRDVVTMRDGLVDFRRVLDDSRIFLARLSQGAIGEENASLLGSLLVSKIHQVTLSRQDLAQGDRRPFFLYLDEFHELATPSMATMFSGVRKYALGLTVAHQDLYQLRSSLPTVERAVLANAHTRICFRVGDEDARRLESGFSGFDAAALTDLGIGEAIVRVGKQTDDFNLRTFELPKVDHERGRELREHALSRWGVPRPTSAPPEPPPEPSPRAKEQQLDDPAQEKTPAATPPQKKRRRLDKTTLDFLEHVALVPFAGVRDRNTELSLSASAGQRIKTSLLKLDLVREIAINPGGRGQHFKLLELTQAGREELADVGVTPVVGLGRGGLAHQWWVTTIASWLDENGVSATIEDESRGARVDITYRVGRERIAVEVETSRGHVLENIGKDLAANFDTVVTLLDESLRIEDIDATVRATFEDQPEELRRIHIGLLPEFKERLALPSSARRLAPQNQNQEPSGTKRRRRRPAPQKTEAQRSSVLVEPGVLTTPAAADYLGLSPATLETMRSRGGGPVFAKLGRRVVYQREDLDAWVKERRKRSTSDS